MKRLNQKLVMMAVIAMSFLFVSNVVNAQKTSYHDFSWNHETIGSYGGLLVFDPGANESLYDSFSESRDSKIKITQRGRSLKIRVPVTVIKSMECYPVKKSKSHITFTGTLEKTKETEKNEIAVKVKANKEFRAKKCGDKVYTGRVSYECALIGIIDMKKVRKGHSSYLMLAGTEILRADRTGEKDEEKCYNGVTIYNWVPNKIR